MIDKLKNKVIIAPMAGVTDRAFREVAELFGAGLVFTEMISAKGLYYGDKKTKSLFDKGNLKIPLCAQIFGHEPDIISKVAGYAVSCGASCLDINSGCPAPKITKSSDGAALMKNPLLFEEVLYSAVKNANCPVSVKIRAGWNRESVNAVQLAKIAEKCGVCMITVHGRTAADYYKGKADWSIIKDVVSSVNIPVVGNGDIFNAQNAKEMLEQTGCAAVMLGRATLGNPWLIRDTVLLLDENKLPKPPSVEEKIKLALFHISLIIKYKGEYIGVRQARKHALWYIKGLKESARVKNLISKANSYEEIEKHLTCLNEF
ncbi:MAG: tRNA dihydrouridine synthase DusB [Firmicutes bacterium]|nr:tRNA dihydrouridine synthase DusB [Bacillota bacterium]